ncbi:hypothetical protein LV779_39050 [Streptomyces thinghirensis]|nr:hypothetical protein [Streptomyces thinghirensis]
MTAALLQRRAGPDGDRRVQDRVHRRSPRRSSPTRARPGRCTTVEIDSLPQPGHQRQRAADRHAELRRDEGQRQLPRRASNTPEPAGGIGNVYNYVDAGGHHFGSTRAATSVPPPTCSRPPPPPSATVNDVHGFIVNTASTTAP